MYVRKSAPRSTFSEPPSSTFNFMVHIKTPKASLFVEEVQDNLRRTSEFAAIDDVVARSLESDLGAIGANTGVMPDFSNESALS